MEYPFDVKDVLISDPFILADPKTHRYYTYATMFKQARGGVLRDLFGGSHPLERSGEGF